MADTGRMNIRINGDNSGFVKSLKDTERQTQQFTGKMQGSMAPLMASMGAAQGAAALAKFAITRKSHSNSLRQGVAMRDKLAGNANSLRAGGHNKLADIAEAKALQQSNANQSNALHGQKMMGQLNVVKKAVPFLLAGGVVTGAIAAASLVALKTLGNQKKLNEGAMKFSGAVSAHEAKLEVMNIQRQLARANDPGFVAQQKRELNAGYNFNKAGATTTGGDIATEVSIIAKNFGTALIEWLAAGGPANANAGNAAINAFNGVPV